MPEIVVPRRGDTPPAGPTAIPASDEVADHEQAIAE
jgi:hypothetical protein